MSISTFSAHWVGPSTLVNNEDNETLAKMYVDQDSLLLVADESNPLCDAIFDRTCYVRSPLNLILPANSLGEDNAVQLHLSTPYRHTSTSVKNDPLLFCTALCQARTPQSTPLVAFCLSQVLKTFVKNDVPAFRSKIGAVHDIKPLRIDVVVNPVFRFPSNKEKKFTKRGLVCFVLLIGIFLYYVISNYNKIIAH